MKCPICEQDNPSAARYCLGCGSRLGLECTGCGCKLPAGSRFCFECGAKVGSEGAAAPRFTAPDAYTPKFLAEKILTSRGGLEGERKQVTVLFADIKGSIELLAGRDPEEARALLDPALRAHDGGGAPLRRHGESGPGRWHHGAVRRAARARGPRPARLLRRPAMQEAIRALRRRGEPHAWPDRADPRRAQLRRGGGARDRQRSVHGLHAPSARPLTWRRAWSSSRRRAPCC